MVIEHSVRLNKNVNVIRYWILSFACLILFNYDAYPYSFKAGSPRVYNVINYGAQNKKAFNSTRYIQRAIDKCALEGGGKVIIPKGDFSTTTIRLKSNVELHLVKGARLFAIPDSALYKNDKEGLQDAGDTFIPSLISAKSVDNISITGEGSVIGQPEFYFTSITGNDNYPGWNENARKAGITMQGPRVKNPKISLLYLSDCSNISITCVKIINSPNWSCHIQWCKKVKVSGITIMSSLKTGVNSDGLDIDGCEDVVVSDCRIATGDDAICLKTTIQGSRSETCKNVIVQNCRLSSSSCAVKIGTETYSDINNVSFSNCVITNSNRGLGIIVRDGAVVSNVSFVNIKLECKRRPFYWWGNGEAFHMVVLKRNVNSKVGAIHHVLLKGITGDVEGTSLILTDNTLKKHAISSVKMDNIKLTVHPESEKDLRTTDGIFISNADSLKLTNINFAFDSIQQTTWRHSLSLNNVNNYLIKEFLSNAVVGTVPVLLYNTHYGNIKLNKYPVNTFIKIDGTETKNLVIFTDQKVNNKVVYVSRNLKDEVVFKQQ